MALSDEDQQRVARIHAQLLRDSLTTEQQDTLWLVNALGRMLTILDKIQAEYDGYRRGIEEGRWQGRAEVRAWLGPDRPPGKE
jgi:hypothetical protein